MFLSNATEEEIQYLHKQISQKVKYFRLESKMSQLELALTIGLKSGAFFGNAEIIQMENILILSIFIKLLRL